MKNLIIKVDISPALQMKMASSKVTSSLSRASEATKSTTGRRLESLCTGQKVKIKASIYICLVTTDNQQETKQHY